MRRLSRGGIQKPPVLIQNDIAGLEAVELMSDRIFPSCFEIRTIFNRKNILRAQRSDYLENEANDVVVQRRSVHDGNFEEEEAPEGRAQAVS